MHTAYSDTTQCLRLGSVQHTLCETCKPLTQLCLAHPLPTVRHTSRSNWLYWDSVSHMSAVLCKSHIACQLSSRDMCVSTYHTHVSWHVQVTHTTSHCRQSCSHATRVAPMPSETPSGLSYLSMQIEGVGRHTMQALATQALMAPVTCNEHHKVTLGPKRNCTPSSHLNLVRMGKMSVVSVM